MGDACLICCFKCAGYPQWRESVRCLKGKIRLVVARKIARAAENNYVFSDDEPAIFFRSRNFSFAGFLSGWKIFEYTNV